MGQLLNRTTVRGRTYYLVRWQGRRAPPRRTTRGSRKPANLRPSRLTSGLVLSRLSRCGSARSYQVCRQPRLGSRPTGPPGLGSAVLCWWPDSEVWQLGRAPFTVTVTH